MSDRSDKTTENAQEARLLRSDECDVVRGGMLTLEPKIAPVHLKIVFEDIIVSS
jgi:hypothetical protein